MVILGDDDPINNPEYPSIVEINDIRVSGEMSSELRVDSDFFTVKSLSTLTQNIDTVSYTEWEWILIPKKSGKSPIKLIIKIKSINKDIVVFNKNVIVKTAPKVVISGFVEKYCQWIFTTIIIPLVIWYWNRKKKKDD
jgi:hypothetical protein